jgi:hypothetical protein
VATSQPPAPLRANVYVDGFNLFRGLLKGERGCKWLDLRALAERMCPHHRIGYIRYFTARVSSPPHDLGKSQRQDTYLRALRAQPNLSVHFGHFLDKRVTGSLLDQHGNPTWVMETVLTREEKGSDVNLATYLILDAVAGHYDVAIVLSNDSDLAEPIRRVRQRFGVAIDVLNPTDKTSSLLQRVASSYKAITLADVQACQLPRGVKAGTQTIERPRGW